ncbi:MAG TPA: peptide ABC transporter substrate-binding protein, partial [Chloroflexota bacterium]|nr:peptide ABC transporter substrate-binding protein [Chloroflexota bacterium]
MRRQVLIAGLTILAVAVVVALTGPPKTSQDVPAAGGSYVEGVVGHPTYLNPLLSTLNDADEDVVSLVFSGLTRLAPDGTVVPDLAQSWTITPDGTGYTFRLRDATWQDGQPITADDVLFTINQIQSPTFPGRPELNRLWQSVKVSRIDARTVRFALAEPYAPFLEYTTIGILPAHALRGIAGDAILSTPFNAQPIGSGPFQVKSATLQEVSLTTNPHYSGKPPYLASITFRYYDTYSDAADALHRGEVQGLAGVPANRVVELANDPKLVVLQTPVYANLSQVILNTQSQLFSDDIVRRSLDLALDRSKTIVAAASGEGVPAVGPIPPNSWAYIQQPTAYVYDPVRAGKLLDDDGWKLPTAGGIREKDGKPFHFVLLAVDQLDRQQTAEEISRELRAIGVDAQVQTAGWSGIVQDYLVPRKFDAVLTEAYTPTADPDPYAFWHSSQVKGGLNVGGWSNRIADALLEDGRHQLDRSARQDDYAKFQELFAQQQPSLLLYHPIYLYAVPASLKGVTVGVMLQPSDRFLTVSDWYL